MLVARAGVSSYKLGVVRVERVVKAATPFTTLTPQPSGDLQLKPRAAAVLPEGEGGAGWAGEVAAGGGHTKGDVAAGHGLVAELRLRGRAADAPIAGRVRADFEQELRGLDVAVALPFELDEAVAVGRTDQVERLRGRRLRSVGLVVRQHELLEQAVWNGLVRAKNLGVFADHRPACLLLDDLCVHTALGRGFCRRCCVERRVEAGRGGANGGDVGGRQPKRRSVRRTHSVKVCKGRIQVSIGHNFRDIRHLVLLEGVFLSRP